MLKLILFLFMPNQSFAANKLLAEGVPATGNALMVSTTNTRVGIATGIPQYTLDVRGGQYTSGQLIVGGSCTVQGTALQVGAASNSLIQIGDASANAQSRLLFLSSNNQKNFQAAFNYNVAGALEFTRATASGGNTFTTPDMVITSVGDIGMGTTIPGVKLDISGNVRAIANGAIFESSQSVAGNASYYVHDNTAEAGGKRWRFGYSGGIASKSAFNFYNQTDAIIGPTFESNGSVGIGTGIPLSKLHVVDGDIRISTTTGSRGIIFQDGTTQNTAASTSTHSVAISTDIAGTISSASGFGTCHSTLTVNFSGAPAYLVVAAMGGINGGGATSTNGLNIMVDGAYPSGLAGGTTGKGIWGCTNGGAVNAVCGISGPIHVFQPTAGSHNICLTERNSGGSFVYGGTSGNQSYAQFVWMVYEMK